MKRQKKLAHKAPEVKELIKKVKYYEYKTYIGHVFTVCMLFGENDSFLARGVSICSVFDNFRRIEGKNKAYGRAIKALSNMGNAEQIRIREDYESDMVTRSFGRNKIMVNRFFPVLVALEHFKFKSEFTPDFTEYERSLFNIDNEAVDAA